MKPLLEASRVSFHVGSRGLLHDVSFSASAGESIALIGPNGAGKSTLLRLLAGELAPSKGDVILRGRSPRTYSASALALHRAVLPQSTTVTFPFSVREIVTMGCGEQTGAAVNKMVDSALAEVDLDGFQDRIIGTLSGGEQQRVHFARVMVQSSWGEALHGPGVLLLDEPTASLDLRHQLDIVNALHRCTARGVVVFIIMHDLNLATRLARRLLVLDNGRLFADGPPSETLTNAMLERVFGIVDAVSKTPRADLPFVLPQNARKTLSA